MGRVSDWLLRHRRTAWLLAAGVALALGVALIAVAVWLVAWLLPACWRLTKRAWRALTGKKEA